MACAAWRARTRRGREHEEQHEHEQRRGSEHAERGQVAVAAAREAAAAALDAHRLFTGREAVRIQSCMLSRPQPVYKLSRRYKQNPGFAAP